jgi:thymidine kinase
MEEKMKMQAARLLQKGRLEVICGSMFSGKTEELMRRLKRSEYAKSRVLAIKHHIDQRKNYSCVGSIMSHDGRERVAFPIEGTDTGIEKILELAAKDVHVIGIDEIQFFPRKIIEIIFALVNEGKRVIAAGLDLDFRGEPFAIVPELLCLADQVTKLKAICELCGQDAHHSQRLINGIPARYHDPIILVGAQECYQARCRNCFIIERPGPSLPSAPLKSNKTKKRYTLFVDAA